MLKKVGDWENLACESPHNASHRTGGRATNGTYTCMRDSGEEPQSKTPRFHTHVSYFQNQDLMLGLAARYADLKIVEIKPRALRRP